MTDGLERQPPASGFRWLGVALISSIWLLSIGLMEGLIRLGASRYWVILADDVSRALIILGTSFAAFRRAQSVVPLFAPVWRAFGWAMGITGVTILYVILTRDLLNLPDPIPTFRHAGYFVGTVCMGWAIYEFPVDSFLPNQRIQALLDGLLISLAIFFIAWGGILRHLVEGNRTSGAGYSFTLIYGLISVALGALWVYQESRLPNMRWGPSLFLLRLSIGLMVIWWPIYAIGSIQGWYRQFQAGARADVLFNIRNLCLGLAALWPGQVQVSERQRRLRDRQSFLAYIPSLLAMGYGAVVLGLGQVFDMTMVVTGTLLGAVISVRHYITVRDLDNLSFELERRVAERTEDLLQNQQKLVKSQRSQLITGMAAGFAHDFKNMLNVTRNWVELLRMEDVPKNLPRGLDAISHATDEALHLMQDVLAAGRLVELEPRTFDLCGFLREHSAAMEGVMGARVALVLALPEKPLRVHMDPGKLGQALVNLASNASDAMRGAGTLTLRARRDRVEPFAVLEVIDSGPGIPPENLERIFEPFFTTKAPGHGTGLGLASVYGTILQSGGTMSVQNQPAGGCAFNMRLPLAR